MREIRTSGSTGGERKRGYARGLVRHLQRAKAVGRPENSCYLVAKVRAPLLDPTSRASCLSASPIPPTLRTASRLHIERLARPAPVAPCACKRREPLCCRQQHREPCRVQSDRWRSSARVRSLPCLARHGRPPAAPHRRGFGQRRGRDRPTRAIGAPQCLPGSDPAPNELFRGDAAIADLRGPPPPVAGRRRWIPREVRTSARPFRGGRRIRRRAASCRCDEFPRLLSDRTEARVREQGDCLRIRYRSHMP